MSAPSRTWANVYAIRSRRLGDIDSWLIVAPITLLAMFLGLLYLGHKSFWLDEALSVSISKMSWSSGFDLVANHEANMALYYAILHVWLSFGESEAYVRALSVLFAVASVPVFYLVGTHLFGKRAGAIAAFLMVINAFWVEYAQEARAYSLAILLVSAAAYMFLKAVETRRNRYWIAYSVICVLAAYSHLLTTLIVPANLVALLFMSRASIPTKQAVWSTALIVLLVSPMAVFTLTQSSYISTTPPASPYRLMEVFYALSGGHATLLNFLPGMTALPLLIYGAAGLLTLAMLRREWLVDRFSQQTWSLVFVGSWLAVPVILSVIVSVHESVLVPRYLVVIFPALVLWVSAGIARIQRRELAVAAFAAVAGVSLVATTTYFVRYEKEDWRGASSYVIGESQPGDAILFYGPSGQLGFNYFLDLRQNQPELAEQNYAYPPGSPQADENPLLLGFGNLPAPDPNLSERLWPGFQRVWLMLAQVSDPSQPSGIDANVGKIESELLERYVLAEERDFEGVMVLRFDRAENNKPSDLH
jgi:mannosyltransferase